MSAGIQLEAGPPSGETPLAGKTFVITGSLRSMNRSEAKEMLVSKGGRVASSVSGSTDYLIVGESPGSKLKRAQELNVDILDEDEFLTLVEKDQKGLYGRV